MQTNNKNILNLYKLNGGNSFQPDNVIRLEAKSNYTKIYFNNSYSLTVARVLKEFESLLVPLGFIRTHRSHLVNKQHVLQVCQKGTAIIGSNFTVEISKRKRTSVMAALKG